MPKRLWFTIRRGAIRGVESLTDEQALARLERGEDLQPVGGADRLVKELRTNLVRA